MKDEQLESYIEDPVSEDMHEHFENLETRSWTEIAHEGLRVYNIVLGEEAEDFSPIDDILTGIAIGAYRAAFRSVAAALAITDVKAFDDVMYDWPDYGGYTQPFADIEGLRKELKIARAQRGDFEARLAR
jgi:hypothetical protein